MSCDLHETIVKDIEHLRSNDADHYTAIHSLELKMAALEERDVHREESFGKLESAMKEGFAKFEGLITALSTQISALANAPAKRAERRAEDIAKVIRDYIILAVLGFLAYKFLGKIGP